MNIGAVPSSNSPTLFISITSTIISDLPSTNTSSQTSNGTHSTSSSGFTITASNSSTTPRTVSVSSTSNLTFSATIPESFITSSISSIAVKSSNSATSLSASSISINAVKTMSSNSTTLPTSTPAPARDQGAQPAQGGENAGTTATSSSSSSSVSAGSSSLSSSSSTSPTSPPVVPTSSSSSSSSSSSPSTPREQVSNNNSPTSNKSQASTTTTSTTVVAAKMMPSTTIVSTITDRPETTLKTPIGLLVTDKQGHTTLSYPAIVTETSVMQQPDGSFVTYTHVVANPTEASNEGSKKSGFFQNHGAVAGVFLALGIILAFIVVCAVLLLRRQKKRKRTSTQRWIDGLHRPPTRSTQFSDNPFVDNPPMTAIDPRHRVTTQSPDLFRLDEGPLIPLTPAYAAGSASPTHHYNQTRKQPPQVDEGPFSDTNGFRPIGTEPAPLHTQPIIPSRQSSPSVYPVSDKDESEDVESDYLPPLAHPRPAVGNSSDSSRPSSTDINPAPPRPPRSILRTPSKIYEEFTSPPSETHSSETHVETTRLGSKHVVEDIFARPTLLNVRPRSKDGESPK